MTGKQFEIPVGEIGTTQLLCRFQYVTGHCSLNLSVRDVGLVIDEDVLDACRQKAMAFVAEMAREENEA